MDEPATTLTGPSEIANFHQRAFDIHLQGTALDVHIEEIRLVAPGVWLACTKGGIIKANGSVVERTGESVQLLIFREQAGLVAIEAFQNARLRPVADAHFEKAAGGLKPVKQPVLPGDDWEIDPLAIMW